MKLIVRPLTDRAWIGTRPRTVSRFTATWADTLDLLEREVYALQTAGMPDPVVMVDATEADLRLDGTLRARAKLGSPAVAVAFESQRGPLMFRCDRYNGKPWDARMREMWQHNVRAIALTLEALRAVDRHGATSSGEQYTGYLQIEPKSAEPMTRDQACEVLGRAAGWVTPPDSADPYVVKVAFKEARRRAHPDMPTGSREQWDLVEQAARVLGVQS